MAKAAKILGSVLAVVLLLLVGAAMLVQTQWAREKLEEQLSQRMDGRGVEIGSLDIDWGWPLGVRLGDVKVENPAWAENPYMLELDALQVRLDPGELMTGSLGVELLGLEKPRVDLSRHADGRSNWEPLMNEDSPENSEPPIQPDRIRISDGQLTYSDAELDAELTLDITTTEASSGERQLSVEGRGNVQGKPLTLTLTGGPPSDALASDVPYAVTLDAQLGEIRARFDGEAAQLPGMDKLTGSVKLSAPESAELISFEHPAIDVPALEFNAQLQRDGQRWALQDIELQTGESRLEGSLIFEQSETPELTLNLHGNQLDLNRWGVMRLLETDQSESNAAGDEKSQSLQERVSQILKPLRQYRGEVDVSLDQLLYGDAALSELVLEGKLADQQLQIERLHAEQGDGGINATGAFDLKQDSLSGDLDADFDQLDLGRALGPLGYETLGTLDGELHGRLAQEEARVSDTQLRYDAPAQDLWIELEAESTESGLELEGNAERNEIPLQFELSLGPLLKFFDEQPYPVEGTLTSRESRLHVDGTVTEPLELKAADVQVSLEGPNPANLNPLTGLDLPPLAPYQLSGHLTWEDEQLRLRGINAEWGESDLSGDVRLSLSGRPMLWANLHSNRLDTEDLKAPGTPTDPTDDQVFSDEPIGLDALRDRGAIIRYEAEKVNTESFPLNGVDLKAELDDNVLLVEPLKLNIGKGRADGRLRIDVGQSQPAGELRLAIESVNLSPVLRDANLSQVADDSSGTLGGRLDLAFEGESLGEMAADLEGKMELAMSGGKLDMLAVELLGLDAGEAAIAALADSEKVEMNCGYLRFASTRGIAELEQLYINTTDSNITGGGEIDLDSEGMDLAFETHAKDFSLLSADSPVQLKGTLSKPQVSVVTDQLVARTLASVAGALIAPPLAILPWVETGLGEGAGAGCRKALDEFERGTGS